MNLSTYRQLDGIAQAELLKKGEISPQELLDTAIKAIELSNPKLNFLAQDLRELANEQLQTLDLQASPLAGVPILLKDLLLQVKGTATQSGTAILKDKIAKRDSALATAYRQAGLIFAGKSTTPELGIHPFTESAFYGDTKNPWDITRTSGGSSGGSGAGVASGAVAIGHGGDGGGSIRIPAAHCGLVGLKPSRGRVSIAPLIDSWEGLVGEHALTRSIRDSAAMLDIATKADGLLPEFYNCPKSEKSYLSIIETPIQPLKIAVCRESFLGGEVAPEVLAGLEHTVKLLENAGHHVEEAKPNLLSPDTFCQLILDLLAGTLANIKHQLSTQIGRKLQSSDVEITTWSVMQLGESISAARVLNARQALLYQARVMAKFHQDYDVLLTPTMPVLAPKLGELRPKDADINFLKLIDKLKLNWTLQYNPIFIKNSRLVQQHVGFTMPFNCTGQPAISLPLYWHEDGLHKLPVGMQFVAPFGREDILLQLGKQLEEIQPWSKRYPDVDVSTIG